MEIEELVRFIIGISIKIHSKIGPGCFEKVYEEILYHELQMANIPVHRQILLPIEYNGLRIENAYKIDLPADNKLVIELKSVFPLHSVYFKQLKTQLGFMNLKYGLILNFKTDLMKDGVHRVYNNNGMEQS